MAPACRFCRLLSGTWRWCQQGPRCPGAWPPSAASPGGLVLQKHQTGLCLCSIWSSPSSKMVGPKIPDSDPASSSPHSLSSYSNLTYSPGPDCPLCFLCPLLLCWAPRGLSPDHISSGSSWPQPARCCACPLCPLPPLGVCCGCRILQEFWGILCGENHGLPSGLHSQQWPPLAPYPQLSSHPP